MSDASRPEVFISRVPGETRLAVTRDGRLADLVITRDGENSILGNIYLGRVEKVLAGLNAAFIDIDQNASGFLAANDGQIFDRDREKPKPIQALFKEGDAVVVQVTREAGDGKGAKLTTRLDLAGRAVVVTQGRPGISISKSITEDEERARLQSALAEHMHSPSGLIIRTKATALSSEALQIEAELLLDRLSDIEVAQKTMKPPACLFEDADLIAKYLKDNGSTHWQCVIVDERATMTKLSSYAADYMPELVGLFELASDPVALFETHDLDQQIDDLFEPRVTLPSGGGLIIEETAALVAIDVDSGAHNRDREPEAFAVAVNEEAAVEVARQLSLRNLAGQIVIDFLPMKRKENREKIQNVLSAGLVKAGKCNVFGFSRLGLLEMTRRRRGESLASRFLSKKSAAPTLGTNAVDMIRGILRELDRNPGKMLTVVCGPKLYSHLSGETQDIWQALLERTGPVVVLKEGLVSPEIKFEIRLS
jgi:ribonuclease G